MNTAIEYARYDRRARELRSAETRRLIGALAEAVTALIDRHSASTGARRV